MKEKWFDVNLTFTISDVNAQIIESCLNELFRIYVHNNYDEGILWTLEMGLLFHTEGEQLSWVKKPNPHEKER